MAMSGTIWRSWCVVAILHLQCLGMQGDEPAGDRKELPHSMAQRLYDELYDTSLPGQYREGEWSLRLQPKVGDFLDDDYVRFLVGIRYGLSNYFDAYADVGTYFMNPAGDGTGTGLYSIRLGSRYTWFRFPGENNNLAAGFNAEIPVSNPPPELTDGFARYEPYLTISHQVKSRPNWLFYLNTTLQLVDQAPGRSHPLGPHPRDQVYLRPGIIFYEGGNFRFSLELEYRTNALHFRRKHPVPGDYQEPPDDVLRPENWVLAYEEVHELVAYPGFTWFPTRKVRDGLRIPGNWDIGLRLKLPLVEETGQDFGISLRFRWFYDYRKFIREDLPGIINDRFKR